MLILGNRMSTLALQRPRRALSRRYSTIVDLERCPYSHPLAGVQPYNHLHNAFSRFAKDFLRWLDKGALMREVALRFSYLCLDSCQLLTSSRVLRADSRALVERSRKLRGEQKIRRMFCKVLRLQMNHNAGWHQGDTPAEPSFSSLVLH